jgi:hypothetical protein
MASIADLPKSELLRVLESCPQQFWPPRPTRQDKSTLVDAIRRAHYGNETVRVALAAAWKRQHGEAA